MKVGLGRNRLHVPNLTQRSFKSRSAEHQLLRPRNSSVWGGILRTEIQCTVDDDTVAKSAENRKAHVMRGCYSAQVGDVDLIVSRTERTEKILKLCVRGCFVERGFGRRALCCELNGWAAHARGRVCACGPLRSTYPVPWQWGIVVDIIRSY